MGDEPTRVSAGFEEVNVYDTRGISVATIDIPEAYSKWNESLGALSGEHYFAASMLVALLDDMIMEEKKNERA